MPVNYESLTVQDRISLAENRLRELETNYYQQSLASVGLPPEQQPENPQLDLLDKQINAIQQEIASLRKQS